MPVQLAVSLEIWRAAGYVSVGLHTLGLHVSLRSTHFDPSHCRSA